MRPAQSVYLYAQPPPQQLQQQQHQQYQYHHHQQQQQQQQAHQQQVPLQLNPQFTGVQQQHLGGNASFYSSHFSQPGTGAQNGMPPLGLPINGGPVAVGRDGGGSGSVLPGPQHMVMIDPRAGLLRQQWGHLRPETQAWGSGVLPSSHQGMMQPPLLQHRQQQQHHHQQQGPYFQELRTPSTGLNEGALPQLLHGGDGFGTGVGVGRGGVSGGVSGGGNFPQWPQPNGKSPFGTPTFSQDNRRPLPDGTRPNEFPSRGISYGNGGQSSANGNPFVGRTYENNHSNNNSNNNRPSSGKWPRGGGGGAGAGGSPHNPRFRGGKGDKGRGGESVRAHAQAGPLRCDICDRTFTSSQQSTAHFSTHVRCDVQGCAFEASGRVVKEHRQSVHDNAVSEMPVRSKPSKPTESEDEVVRWREERKLNYPTAAHIKRKVEETKARKARGELVDDDARKRRERLKEILAKQAELGVPVAEVPAYYMSDRYGALKAQNGRLESSGSNQNESRGKNAKRSQQQDPGDFSNGPNKKTARCSGSGSGSSGKDDHEGTAKRCRVQEDAGEGPPTKVSRTSAAESSDLPKPISSSVARDVEMGQMMKEESMTPVIDPKVMLPEEKTQTSPTAAVRPPPSEKRVCVFFKRGRCKKGSRCQFLHERRPKNNKKKGVTSAKPLVEKRPPNLLAKLLNTDIRKEKSLLLQAFRFFVNNMFLLDFPQTSLNFFNWQDINSAGGGDNLEADNSDIMDLVGQEDNGEDSSGTMDLDRHDATHDQNGDGDGEVTRSDGEIQGVVVESSEEGEEEEEEEEEFVVGLKYTEKGHGAVDDRDQTQTLFNEDCSSDCQTD